MSGLSPANIRTTIRDIVGIDSSDKTDNDLDIKSNQALWWLQNRLNLPENEQINIVQTVAGQASYPLSYPVEGLLAISLKDPNTDELIPLNLIGGYASDDETSFAAEAEGVPKDFERFGNAFFLRPIPDDAYDLYLRQKETIADITSATTSIALDPVLHEVLIYAAAERVFLDLRDFNSSDRMKREWGIKLQGYKTQDEKEQPNWKYAQVKVVRPSYGI